MSTFFERNKKKTALAALLLFIRQRKALSALLLLVALASFLFVSPSYSLIDLPGGSRLAAGVAWIAGKLGLGRDKRSFDELMAAFKAAKEGNGRAGWGSFFGSGGAGPDSLGLVAGRRSDLESGASAEDKLGRKGSVAGIVNPDDKRNQADGVSLSDADLAGEREGLVKNAFAGGFGPGFGRGGLGRGDGVLGASLSGGAYAGKGFFGGKRGAAGSNGREDYEKAIREASVPATSGRFVKNGVPGRMSSSVAKKIGASIEQGMKNLNILPSDPNSGIKQLGQARGCSSLAVTANCRPGECPGEAAASASGAVYVGAQDCETWSPRPRSTACRARTCPTPAWWTTTSPRPSSSRRTPSSARNSTPSTARPRRPNRPSSSPSRASSTRWAAARAAAASPRPSAARPWATA
jgi:hypothetical protein